MSAYMVEDEHIHLMVTYILRTLRYGSTTFYCPPFSSIEVGTVEHMNLMNLQSIWDCLWQANKDSVESVYGDRMPVEDVPAPFQCLDTIPEPLQMIKHVHCYIYQSCELDEFYRHKAKAICDGIIDAAVSRMPGYDECAWGL